MTIFQFALFFGCFLGNFCLFAERQEIHIPREDGTLIQGYFDRPEGETDVPVVVFIEGSYEASVVVNHDKLAARLSPLNIGLISLEKRGITSTKMDKTEFLAHDCFEERLHDYSLLLEEIQNQGITRCNGRVVLLGGSEGGKIAPRLSLAFPSMVQGVVLVASGGGVSFGEEMKYQMKTAIQQFWLFKRLAYNIRGLLFSKELDQEFDKMLNNPESLEISGGKTWKWFASYLRYDLLSDLLKIEVPIYMVHGEEDSMVPIQSADCVKEAFDQAGKTNLHYARYQNLGHSLTGRDEVYAPMLEWINMQVFKIHPKENVVTESP